MDKSTIAKMTEEISKLDTFHWSEMRKFAPDADDTDLRLAVWRAMQPLMNSEEGGKAVFRLEGEVYVRLTDAQKIRRAVSFHKASGKKLARSLKVIDAVDEKNLQPAQIRVASNVRNRIAREMVQAQPPKLDPADIKAPARPRRSCAE